jgi:4-hydroxy 2-oxovalerate aldolase
MQAQYGWGSNPYYYLAGQYGIHPTYVQEMLADSRYGEAEILSVMEHLRVVGGKKFSNLTMEDGRQMYGGDASGSWAPASVMHGREVLILGVGPGVVAHREELQHLVRERKLFVIALNTQTIIDAELIDMRAACHPFRLLADCETYRTLPQPLAIPEARLLGEVRESFSTVTKYDFGLTIKLGVFEFHEKFAVTPSSLVVAYALAMATSGKASRILLAGFDGFGADDPRTVEMEELLTTYQAAAGALPIVSITPTHYNIPSSSVYSL